MALTSDEIRHLAELSKLHFDDQQVETLNAELNHIFDMVDIINQTDVSTIEPLTHPVEAQPHYRDDAAIQQQHAQALLDIAPDAQQDLYVVPAAIEDHN